MNSMDFLQKINDLDDDLILSSANLLYQEEDMDKRKVIKGASTLSKIILVAAIMAGIVGITAVAAELFPSLFPNVRKNYVDRPLGEWGQRRAEVFGNAVGSGGEFEAVIIDLPELNNSQVVIGETYFDGEHFAITYRLDENKFPARFDLDRGSPEFKMMRQYNLMPYENKTIETCLKLGILSQEEYDVCMTNLKESGLECVKRFVCYDALANGIRPDLTEDDWSTLCEKMRKDETVGVVLRHNQLVFDVYLEDGSLLPYAENSAYGGCGRSLEPTEFGNVFAVYDLPEEFKDTDSVTVYLTFRSYAKYYYMNPARFVWYGVEPAAEQRVPVTLTRTEK